MSLSLSLSLSESQQDLGYLCLVNTNSPLSSAAELPGYEIMPLCFLRSQEVHVHGIADIVNELSFYALNEWKNEKKKKKKKNDKKKKKKKGKKRKKTSRCYFHDLKYFYDFDVIALFSCILKPL